MTDTTDLTAVHAAIDALYDATQRLVRSVDTMTDDTWHGDSLLPGWTRAHLVAHLTLNAEGLAGSLEGLRQGRGVPMYPSAEARDHDIEELSGAAVPVVRDRLLGSVSRFADAVAAMDDQEWSRRIDRVPGGPTFRAAAVPAMRWREVEIHHVDLAVGYGHQDWPHAFAEATVDSMAARLADLSPGFRLLLTDAGRERDVGNVAPDAPVVRGSAADTARWLSGRGDGTGMSSEGGDLPQIGAW
ncbi:maleylpyruvate isomerase family mycothiol-dependent enzyme [Nocardioides marinus]|uniref:Maleylpyruvate isomerase n=1 Tax=Nocardioides marinus TaxID=374514 RepID=A0A7Y9YDP6_9ACTN|nr:maleylpyruvate isomerase [Nocardioides marinus]